MELNEFYRYINKFRLKERKNKNEIVRITHTSIGNPKGSYYIPNTNFLEMMDIYSHSIENGEKIHLNEYAMDLTLNRPKKILKIRIDLDIKQPIDCPLRQFDDTQLKLFVVKYNEILKKYIEIDNMKDMMAYITMREKPYKLDGYYHDGIHIMYPEISCHVELQRMMREELLSELPRIFDGINITNSFADVYDEGIITKPIWLMYGSSKVRKNVVLEPYLLHSVLNSKGNKVKIKTDKAKPLVKKLSILANVKEYDIKDEFREQFEARINPRPKMYAPIDTIGEMIGNNQPNQIYSNNPEIAKYEKILTNYDNDSNLSKSKLDEIIKLVDMLSPERANPYNEWIHVGLCLKGISELLFSVWDNFSKKCPEKYKPGECANKWKTFKMNGHGLSHGTNFFKEGTLHMWAKTDSPNEYYEYMNVESLSGKIEKAGNDPSHSNVASIIYHMYKYKFCLSAFKDDGWYEYVNHRWKENERGVGIWKKLTGEVVKTIYAYASQCLNKVREIENNEENGGGYQNLFSQNMKNAFELTGGKKLGDYTFKDKLVKECKPMFYREDFANNLDEHRNLIGFRNGVYDLDATQKISDGTVVKGVFRDGHPDDLVSYCTGNDYIEFDDDDPILEEIHEYMSQVFVDSDLRTYVWKLLSSFMSGHHRQEIFPIFTGNGANSKSILLKLYKLAYGDYCHKMNITQLTQIRKHGSQANPEVAQSKGKRFVQLDEAEKGAVLNTGAMKELTGGDPITVRALYKNSITFYPQFHPVMVCNDMPKIDSDDDGTWRRIRVIPFLSKFCDNPDPSDQCQFPKDGRLTEKLHKWKEAFMYILLQHYRLVDTEGMHEPPIVIKASEEYRITNDTIAEFISECIIEEANSKISQHKMHEQFKKWFKKSHEGLSLPAKKSFIDKIKKKLNHIPISSRGFVGINVILPDDQEKDDEQPI
jgi:P4 family phage/plasmid primase-like protien